MLRTFLKYRVGYFALLNKVYFPEITLNRFSEITLNREKCYMSCTHVKLSY